MKTLLVGEHDNKTLREATAKALSCAASLGGEVDVVIAGKGCRAVAEQAAQLSGVARVMLADADAYAHMLAEPFAALIVSLAAPYDAILAPSTSSGRNILPRVAALLDAMQISDVSRVLAPDTFERPIYAGNVIETVRTTDEKKVITVRTTAFPRAAGGGTAPVEPIPAVANPGTSQFESEELHASAPGELHQIYRTDRRQAGSRNWCLARGSRRRLRPERLAGGPDGQDRRAGSVHCRGHLWRHSASGRYQRREGHCRDQQGSGCTDLSGGRLRPGCRSVYGASGNGRRAGQV